MSSTTPSRSGDVEPAFVIFRRYQQRSRERMAYAIELLNKKPDFDVDESFNFDREKEPWPANAAEMNELWRKRVKNDALSLVIAGKSVAGSGRCVAQALRACREAHGSEQAGRCIRGVHERLRAVARSAFELFLGAQLRGIQHSDELELRGHRRLAAAHRRLRHRHRRHRRAARRPSAASSPPTIASSPSARARPAS